MNKKVKLSSVAKYVSEKIDNVNLTKSNYVGVDNMISNYGGIQAATSIPAIGTSTKFKAGDILIGNIRPYFKKIWFATFDGGCSQDVLVVRCLDTNNSKYVYAALSTDEFFEYDMKGAKGSKMPRGDKAHIMEYEINFVPNYTQIGDLLIDINMQIQRNKDMVHKLQVLAQTTYSRWFNQFEFPNEHSLPYKSSGGKMVWNDKLKREIPDGWNVKTLGDLLLEEAKSKIQVGDAKNDVGKFPFFTSGEDILSYRKNFVDGPHCYLNTGGNADVKFFDGKAAYSTDTWCISFGEHTYLINEFLQLIKPQMDRLFFSGSGLQHLQKESFKQLKVIVPNNEILAKYNGIATDCYQQIANIYIENNRLQALKGNVLPLLINRQLNV